MRYLPYRIDPRLAWALDELQGTKAGDNLLQRLESLASIAQPRPEGPALDVALGAHRAVIGIAASGIRLTQAGYLPPAMVRAIAPHLPTMDDWIFPIEREVHAQPVQRFREHLIEVGLLRKASGSLMITAAGRRALGDSTVLWGHIAARLVPSRRKFDAVAMAIILLHVATAPSRQPHVYTIAESMTALGWRQSTGGPILARDVQWPWNNAWGALGCVGTPVGTCALSRIVGQDAVLLIRDALLVKD